MRYKDGGQRLKENEGGGGSLKAGVRKAVCENALVILSVQFPSCVII